MPRQKPLTGEAALIAALHRLFGPAPEAVAVGIGDDCAVLAVAGPDYLLWTVDTLIEGVHFDLSYFSLPQVGSKALMVNLSDVAAMGTVALAMENCAETVKHHLALCLGCV